MAQQNTLDFVVAAHTKGMEQIAELINRVGALEAATASLQVETKKLSAAQDALGKSTERVVKNGKTYNNALDAQSKALRQSRQGTQMAMMQFNDFATSVSTGADPITAFNQQIGQLGWSMSLMEGTAGRVGRFLSGPWGVAIIAATAVLGFFAKGAIEASDRTVDFEKTASTAANSITQNLTEALQPAIERLGPVIEAVTQLWDIMKEIAIATVKGVVELINRLIGAVIGTINASVILVSNGMNIIKEIGVGVMNSFIMVANFVITNVENFINNAKGVVNNFLGFIGSTFRFAETKFKRLEMVTNKWAGSTEKAGADAGRALVDGFRSEIIDLDELDIFTKPKGKKGKGGKSDTSAADKAKKEADRLAKIQEAINIRNAKSKIFWAEYWSDREDEIEQGRIDAMRERANGIAAISEQMGERVAKDVGKPMKLVEESFAAIGNSVSDAFKGMITGATSWKDAMRGIISSVIDELWRLYVVQQIVGLVTSALNPLKASATANIAANPDLFANGTVNAPGGMAWVGERGPELVNLPRGSQVIPAHRAQSMGGGGVTVNVDARGSADPAAVRAQVEAGIMQAAPAIIAAAQQRTVSSLRRPRLGGAMQ